jgi:hypothetical protein
MSFLKFLDKKEHEADVDMVDNDLSLPPLPPIEGVPEEIENPFEDLTLPPLPSLEESVNEEISEVDDDLDFKFPDLNDIPDEFKDEIIPVQEVKVEEFRSEGPIFVNISGFKELIDDIDQIKLNLRVGNSSLRRVLDLKDVQDKRFLKWQAELHEAQRKLMYIDNVLFETKHY